MYRLNRLRAVLLVSLACAAPAAAEVTRLEIRERLPYAGGRSFGAVGAYERLLGKAYFAVDPNAEANATIVDLDLAPRNAGGKVEFSADVEILAPVDPAKGNGTLLYDVNNRGNRVAPGMFNGGADEFLMRQGYVVAWSGWIGELQPGGDRLRLFAPTAMENGRPIRGKVRAEMSPDAPTNRLSIAQWANHGSYPPTARGLKEATLTYRLREKDRRIPLPRSQWRLEVRPSAGSLDEPTLPVVELVLDSGFRPGHLYELIYEAEGPVLQGLGLAGIRDLVSFLKYDRTHRNPLRLEPAKSAVKHAIGFGVSQSGRALRMLLYDGLNADEQGRRVFDGLMPHVAGAGLGFFNHRFASPTRHSAQHDHHLYPTDVFPFTYGDEEDPFTRRTDGILRRARAAGVVPKIFHTQTSAEYWHRSGSLVHTDPLGRRDALLPPEVRIYTFGGAQHGPGNGIPGRPGNGQQATNPTDYRPLLRGLLTALNEWVSRGVEPPPSRYPRISDGTLVGWQKERSGWPNVPGVTYPSVIQQPEFLDYGPEFAKYRRLTRLPPARKGDYVVLVPAFGPDGNERGTLQVPSVAVPTGSFTGWNLRAPSIGADTELLSLAGSYIPFPRTADEKSASGDPRPALLQRYPTFEAYRRAYAAATQALVRDRYLLAEDEPRLLALAERFRELWEKRPGE
jgi:hypothetical protein